MHRTTSSVLALSIVTLSLAATSSAVPIFVELKIREPLAAVNAPDPVGDDQLVLPDVGPGKGKSNAKGSGSNSGKANNGNGGQSKDPFAKSNLRALTLWISSDGTSWKTLGGEVVDLSGETLTARVDAKGDVSTSDALATFGLPALDSGSGTSGSYYLGVSTSSTNVWEGAYSAQLVSWSYFSPNGQAVSIPEPTAWPLFTAGLFGLGVALAARKSR
jgi:hypothetical protein